jgi:multimeric flavodoxin WrbA
MHILGINSSLRQPKHPITQHRSFTRELLEHGLQYLTTKHQDVTTELIDLGDYKIDFEAGAYSSNEHFIAAQNKTGADDISELCEKVLAADGVIFSSPTYWGYPSGLLKAFIDRLTALDEVSDDPRKRPLDGKVAGAIATAKFDGSSRVAQDILSMANYLGFIIPPHAFAFHTGRMTTSVVEDDAEFDANYFAKRNACAVAENVYRMIKATHNIGWKVYQEFTHPISADEASGTYNLAAEHTRIAKSGYFHSLNKSKDV